MGSTDGTIQSTTEIPTDVTVVPPKQTDYPNIKFWFKREWTKYCNELKVAQASVDNPDTSTGVRGKSRAAEGINVMMLYIETEDGRPVDGDVASDIREAARSIWTKLDDVGIAPARWGQANLKIKREYLSKMVELFPYIGLCHQGWKAHQVATDFYPKWYKGSQTRKEREKEAPKFADGKRIGSGGSKRSRKDSTKTVQKRMRPDSDAFVSRRSLS